MIVLLIWWKKVHHLTSFSILKWGPTSSMGSSLYHYVMNKFTNVSCPNWWAYWWGLTSSYGVSGYISVLAHLCSVSTCLTFLWVWERVAQNAKVARFTLLYRQNFMRVLETLMICFWQNINNRQSPEVTCREQGLCNECLSIILVYWGRYLRTDKSVHLNCSKTQYSIGMYKSITKESTRNLGNFMFPL